MTISFTSTSYAAGPEELINYDNNNTGSTIELDLDRNKAPDKGEGVGISRIKEKTTKK